MTSQRTWVASYPEGVPAQLHYGDLTLWDQFAKAATDYPARPALDFMGAITTYAQLDDQVARAAQGLKDLGIGPGDRVAVLLPNCPAAIISFYAILRLGAIVVEHNPLYTIDELRHPFSDHGATVAIVWDKIAPMVSPLTQSSPLRHVVAVNLTEDLPRLKRLALRLPLPAARKARAAMTGAAPGTVAWKQVLSAERLPADTPLPQAADIALMLYTSGTTGTPKGVPLSHANIVANCMQGRAWVPGLTPGREVFLATLPMFHAYGVTMCVAFGIALAAQLTLLPRPDVDLIIGAMKHKLPTFIPAVPPLYARILDAAEDAGLDLQGINNSFSGAMPLPAELVDRWESATGGFLIEGYGMTECSPIVVGNPRSAKRRPGHIGIPFPDTDVRVVDRHDPSVTVELGTPGELLVRGPQVFSGYYGLPEATAAAFHDGWYRTGDVVVQDADGFLAVVDRIKEMIVTGGFNVYPSEVEAVLRQHPSIEEVAVVGLPGRDGSERVVAAVTLSAGTTSLDEEAIRDYAKQHLAGYKVPRSLYVQAELPTNPMGKILRREVAAQVRAQLQTAG